MVRDTATAAKNHIRNMEPAFSSCDHEHKSISPPEMIQYALSVENLSKRFGQFEALRDLNFDVKTGEVFALLGPNGAGKTTLIGCVAGSNRITSGNIRVFGKDVVRDYRSTRRAVGVMPQEIAFDPFFTPKESLLIQMGLMGHPKDPKWADELLRKFSLYDKRDAYTRQLSGGMKRRLLIAKALAHRPQIVFLDEPTAGVDVDLRKDLWKEVELLRGQGVTVVLTTHYLEEAERLADTIAIMHQGKLVRIEPKASLLASGQHYIEFELSQALREPLPQDLQSSVRGISDKRIQVRWQSAEDLQLALRFVAQLPVENLHVENTQLERVFLELVGKPKAT